MTWTPACSVCGKRMEVAAVDAERTAYACASPEARFIGKPVSSREWRHYQESRVGVRTGGEEAMRLSEELDFLRSELLGLVTAFYTQGGSGIDPRDIEDLVTRSHKMYPTT